MLRSRSFEHTVVWRKADLERIFVFLTFLLVLSNQAWEKDKEGKDKEGKDNDGKDNDGKDTNLTDFENNFLWVNCSLLCFEAVDSVLPFGIEDVCLNNFLLQ